MPFFVDVEATRFRGERFPVESTTGPRRASTCPASPVTLGPSPMITSVRLEGFKNFRDATLHLGPLTVIVGTNASGKSNIRDAFRFLHGMGRGYSLAEIIGEKYVEGGVLVWKGIRGGIREVAFDGTSSFRMVISADDSYFEHDIAVDVSDQLRGPKVSRESFRSHAPGGRDYLFQSHSADELLPHNSLHKLHIQVPTNWMPPRTKETFLFPDNTPVLSQLSQDKRAIPEVSLHVLVAKWSLESIRFLDLSPEVMKVPSIPGQIILGDRGENLSSVLQDICTDKDSKHALTEWVRQLTPLDVSDFDFVPDQQGKVLLTLIESTGRRTSAYSASDGTLRFLAIIAALMGPDSAKFYFLEEIDNGIHPTRLALLLQLIEQQTKHRGIQVVTTTHSPQLLAMLSPEARQHASLVYRLEGSTEAKITRIVDIPGANEVLETQNLGRLHESGWLENAVQFANVAETP